MGLRALIGGLSLCRCLVFVGVLVGGSSRSLDFDGGVEDVVGDYGVVGSWEETMFVGSGVF